MPLCALLNLDDPIYDFEHAMAHRAPLAVMAPLDRFSVLPYFVEPWPFPHPPLPHAADGWNLDHQQAHNDFARALPGNWLAPAVGVGIPSSQNLVDSDWNDPRTRAWTTFVNHQEHYIASEAILPLPTAYLPGSPRAPGWWAGMSYPFW